MESANWLECCGANDPSLERLVENKVAAAISSAEISGNEIERIKKLTFLPKGLLLDLNEGSLEKLRRMCQLWDIELRPSEITSHRRVIGPVIVAAKKLVYPILRALLKDIIRQQRDFNAATISLFLNPARMIFEKNHEQ